jgi:hypothetical protein
MDADAILNHGEPAWWHIRGMPKAHLIVDVRGEAQHDVAAVMTRCGQHLPQTSLYVPVLSAEAPKCRSCRQRGAIR